MFATALLAVACSDGSSAPKDAASQVDAERTAARQRGRQIYQNVCIACHASDPAQPGSLGPQLVGASRELIEAKVLRGEYPPGYTPLRPSQAMPRYEYLKDRLGDVAIYLQQD